MAADLYLLSLCEQSPAVFIRLYSWEKPSITLGVTEKPDETLDLAAIAAHGVEWVRRPTGGRSVLHDNDITYSCIFSAGANGMGATLMETYRILSECLMNGLRHSGIDCASHNSAPENDLLRSKSKLPCFLSPNRHEVMVSGKKLIGSAQKRTSRAVLQHGSIPLTPGFRLLPEYLQLSWEQREAQKLLLARKTVCIEEILPGYDEKKIRKDLVHGFAETLPYSLPAMPWSLREHDEIVGFAERSGFY
jgi:lipoate-protein ligase A